MNIAYCICPNFLSSNISNPTVFSSVFMNHIGNSGNQVVLDSNESLWTKYLELVSRDNDSFIFFKTWERTIKAPEKAGKILISDVDSGSQGYDCLVDSAIHAVTTSHKAIAICDNNRLKDRFDDIKDNRVELVNLNTFSDPEYPKNLNEPDRRFIFNTAKSDIIWILHRLKRSLKSIPENDINSYVRDLLLARRYGVKDQTLEGESSTGKSAGSLDIIIEENSKIVCIIEPLYLGSVKVNDINIHYNKLLHNYNPLKIPYTFLITYYKGKNFKFFWEKYKSYIENLDPNSLSRGQDTNFIGVEEMELAYPTIRAFTHHGKTSGYLFQSVHIAVDLS